MAAERRAVPPASAESGPGAHPAVTYTCWFWGPLPAGSIGPLIRGALQDQSPHSPEKRRVPFPLRTRHAAPSTCTSPQERPAARTCAPTRALTGAGAAAEVGCAPRSPSSSSGASSKSTRLRLSFHISGVRSLGAASLPDRGRTLSPRLWDSAEDWAGRGGQLREAVPSPPPGPPPDPPPTLLPARVPQIPCPLALLHPDTQPESPQSLTPPHLPRAPPASLSRSPRVIQTAESFTQGPRTRTH